jgi:hypothetical protein
MIMVFRGQPPPVLSTYWRSIVAATTLGFFPLTPELLLMLDYCFMVSLRDGGPYLEQELLTLSIFLDPEPSFFFFAATMAFVGFPDIEV